MKQCAIELVGAIKKLTAEEEVRPRQQIEALQKLRDIFKLNLDEDNAGDEIRATTSATPTTKAAIRETPRVHRRLTHNNTPEILPTFEGGKQKELLATSEGEKKRKKRKFGMNRRKLIITTASRRQLTVMNKWNKSHNMQPGAKRMES